MTLTSNKHVKYLLTHISELGVSAIPKFNILIFQMRKLTLRMRVARLKTWPYREKNKAESKKNCCHYSTLCCPLSFSS